MYLEKLLKEIYINDKSPPETSHSYQNHEKLTQLADWLDLTVILIVKLEYFLISSVGIITLKILKKKHEDTAVWNGGPYNAIILQSVHSYENIN
jgi:hypothetical protein